MNGDHAVLIASLFTGLVAAALAGPQLVLEDGDPTTAPADTAPPVQEVQDVAQMRERVTATQAKMNALEHYLADQLAVKEGKAPKGWVQPDFSEYEKPGAPSSFIPPSPPK